MPVYSPFFQTVHDELGPVGSLGRGTHYSILRCIVWHDETLKPSKQAAYHDIAIVWDEDHDERVIELLEGLYTNGLLASVAFLGERKGTATLLVLDSTAKSLGPSGMAKLNKAAEDLAQALDDSWPAHVATLSSPGCIIDDSHDKVARYIQTIHMLWNLGAKPMTQRLDAKRSETVSALHAVSSRPPFVVPAPAPGPVMHNYDGSEAMTVAELRNELSYWSDNFYVTFSGGLTFGRMKSREVNHVDIELSPTVYIDRKKYELHVDELTPR